MSDQSLGFIGIDLTKRKPNDGATAPKLHPGEYRLEIVKVEGGQTRDGNPKMVVRYKVTAALTDEPECQDAIGKVFPQSMSLNEEQDFVLDRLANLVSAAGVKMTKRGFDPSKLIGCEIVAEISHREVEMPNPATGEPQKRSFQQVIRERSVEEYEAESDEEEEEAPKRRKRKAKDDAPKRRKRKAKAAEEEEEEEYEADDDDDGEDEEEEEEEKPRRRRRAKRANSSAANHV